MKTETQEFLEVIATRVPPGDRWTLVGDKVVQNSITETLETWFQKTGEKAEFRLAPLQGKLYVIRTEEVEVKPEPPKRFNIYGDY
jgi:16S rRNA G1207 methylase RsmC